MSEMSDMSTWAPSKGESTQRPVAHAERGSLLEASNLLAEAIFRLDGVPPEWSSEVAGTQLRVQNVQGMPQGLVNLYLDRALRHAVVDEIEPGRFFAEVKVLVGAWAEEDSRDKAIEGLRLAVRGWLEVRLSAGLEIPVIDGVDVNRVRSRESAA